MKIPNPFIMLICIILFFPHICIFPQYTGNNIIFNENTSKKVNVVSSIEGEQKDINYASNVIFFEAGGHGFFASINYEKFFSKRFALRVGIGSVLMFGNTYPAMINYYVGDKNNKLELGAGFSYFNGAIRDSFFGNRSALLLGATIGLRHQKTYSGVVIRVSLTPLYNPGTNHVLPMGGLSVGYAFF